MSNRSQIILQKDIVCLTSLLTFVKAKEEVSQPLELPTPKFVVFANTEEGKDLSKDSPFLINKATTTRVGPVASIVKLQNETLLVKISSQKQSLSLLKMSSFFEQLMVSVEPHQSLKYSKGVGTFRKLLHITFE